MKNHSELSSRDSNFWKSYAKWVGSKDKANNLHALLTREEYKSTLEDLKDLVILRLTEYICYTTSKELRIWAQVAIMKITDPYQIKWELMVCTFKDETYETNI